jgi:hypothetical protein
VAHHLIRPSSTGVAQALGLAPSITASEDENPAAARYEVVNRNVGLEPELAPRNRGGSLIGAEAFHLASGCDATRIVSRLARGPLRGRLSCCVTLVRGEVRLLCSTDQLPVFETSA